MAQTALSVPRLVPRALTASPRALSRWWMFRSLPRIGRCGSRCGEQGAGVSRSTVLSAVKEPVAGPDRGVRDGSCVAGRRVGL